MSFRILYIDDEADIREIASLSLSLDPEFDVRTCSSGAEAIPIASSWGPDLILLDVMMPELDGPATFAALRGAGVLVPIVFFTARSQAADIARLTAMGAAGVLAKPFEPMTLAATVRQYLAP